MASRKTRQAAQELKAKFQERHPDLIFKITDVSRTYQMSRATAERWGREIIGGDETTATVRDAQFKVSEVRICVDCGAEILTAAIGEIGDDRCPTCRETSKAAFKAELTARKAASAKLSAEREWRNNWEE